MDTEDNKELGFPFIHPAAHFKVVSVLSSANYTFKIEQFTSSKTIIHVTAFLGSAHVLLPKGVTVEVAGSSLNFCGSGSNVPDDKGAVSPSDSTKDDVESVCSKPKVILQTKSVFGCITCHIEGQENIIQLQCNQLE